MKTKKAKPAAKTTGLSAPQPGPKAKNPPPIATVKGSHWENHIFSGPGYQSIKGKDCDITIEPRPAYCDRGNWLAKLFAVGSLASSIDGRDGWPRYYFDEARARLEIEAWLKKRGQWL